MCVRFGGWERSVGSLIQSVRSQGRRISMLGTSEFGTESRRDRQAGSVGPHHPRIVEFGLGVEVICWLLFFSELGSARI